MIYLLIVSFVWAFSFGLVKVHLSGIDSAFLSATRLGLAFLAFLPFLRLRGLAVRSALSLAAIGAVQFGLMYLALNASYQHLQAHEVALFTLTTPIFVTLFADALEKKFRAQALIAALVAGAAVMVLHNTVVAGTWIGFALVQLSNASFAIGQILYRKIRARQTTRPDMEIFALLYAGALAVTLPVAIAQSHINPLELPSAQIWTLLYLGIIASGAAFFLWNLGCTRVNTGTLAVFNNAKIPLAVACSLLFFNESADLKRLLASAALLLAAIRLARPRTP